MKLTKADIDKVRHIEGFPIAKDEDIIALSRPPYYTACPNPFIRDFIQEHGTPYDEATDDYHREPLSIDLADDKYDKVYHFHPYHTKVPYGIISRLIKHYTNPDALIMDSFCGSGMTGVAAKTAISNGKGRHSILIDLSPFSTFISDVICQFDDFKMETIMSIRSSLALVEKESEWMFSTRHYETGLHGEAVIGIINFVIWSDVLICPSCSKEFIFWDTAVEKKAGKVRSVFSCPHCGTSTNKRECSHAMITQKRSTSQNVVSISKQVPVLINYSIGKSRYEKEPDDYDLKLLDAIEKEEIPYWYPTDELPDGDKTSEPKNLGLRYVDQFYFKRNLWVLASLYDKLASPYERFIITKVAFRITKRYGLTYQNGSWGAGGGPTNGTLYIPSLIKELSIIKQIGEALKDFEKIELNASSGRSMVSTQSATDLRQLPDNSIDYIFIDPPFGGNLCYSELNFIWESWLKIFTNNKREAIMNITQTKTIDDYHLLISLCFGELYRTLKPNRWMTVIFHNSSNAVWNVIQDSILHAGFLVADVRIMDKGKMSFTQITSVGSVKSDLIISVYKPKVEFVKKFRNEAGSIEMAWEFVHQHLGNVPIAPDTNSKIEIVAERQDYLLFDRMVAYHINNGFPIPMDAHTFYEGLRQRFLERDSMFFLPDQVTAYDEKRMHMDLDTTQFSFVVTDEKNAIQWLNYILKDKPQTYQDIQPQYLQELHQDKREQMPELLDMLRDNFLQDEQGRFYIPDLSKAADLAKLRIKKLLKEFYDSYVPGKGKLKAFRMEAIRAGFDDCWNKRDYKTIINVGERLPENVLQEDPALLMYYDNACVRR